jgi:alpha-galactosidase/6-phospho-beta-glucosidase family protein
MRVTIIGGGSYQWSPKLVTDLLAVPALAGMELVLEDIDRGALEDLGAYARLAARQMGVACTVTTTTDQRAALEGADFVIVTISTGGFESMAADLDVPARHGVRQSVGDSVGPGGISRSLRNVPVLVGIARDMESLCPEAWMLNITNPMSCLTRAVCKETSVRAVGLCHEVGNFCMDLAIALGVPHSAVVPTVTGVNHFPVITALAVDGDDGFERVARIVDEHGGLEALAPAPGQPEADPFTTLDFCRRHLLTLTLFDRFGALLGANDRHLAEFVPWVLSESSGWGAGWGIELTTIAARQKHQDEYVAEVRDVLGGSRPLATWDSGELVAPVIDSLLTGTRREVPANIPNRGQCPDLPHDALVESICVVDAEGLHGRDQAHAPRALAELLRRHVEVHELTVDAAVRGDRALALAAAALDPLAGRGDLHEVEAMVEELLGATARWLPQFAT